MTAGHGPSQAARRPVGWRALAFDGSLALLAMAVEVGQAFGYDRSPPPVAVGLALGAGAVLVRRRYEPLVTLGVSLAAVCGVAIAGVAPAGFAPLIALYTVAATSERRVSLAALMLTAVVTLVVSVAGPADQRLFDPIAAVVCAIGAWGFGVYVETQREYRREQERRAAMLKRERDQLVRIAAHEERASIARELHDIVAHSVSVMLVGVRGARDVLRSDPDVADATLGKVETSAEESLAELRRILALLRKPATGAESRPQPSLTQLDQLVADYRDAGLPVSLERIGRPRPLPGGFELSVYRIVQEALTNVLKHAHPKQVVVTLAFRDSRLDLEVIDDGSPQRQDAVVPGHGLVGMRERVDLLGGELETGRRASGGFRVAARLPVEVTHQHPRVDRR
jgi:signal transduction histidine kinase